MLEVSASAAIRLRVRATLRPDADTTAVCACTKCMYASAFTCFSLNINDVIGCSPNLLLWPYTCCRELSTTAFRHLVYSCIAHLLCSLAGFFVNPEMSQRLSTFLNSRKLSKNLLEPPSPPANFVPS